MCAEQLKPKTAIRWTEQEWDKLAELVFAMRRNTPEDSIAAMANRAQKQFPKDRQRPGVLTMATVGPLIERIKQKDREQQAKADKCDELAAKLSFFEDAPATRKELLTTLSDEEIRAHFLPRLLQMLAPVDVVAAFNSESLLDAMETANLAAVVARRLVADFKRPINVVVQMPEQRLPAPPAQRQKVNTNGSNGKRKKIVIVGTKGDQPRHLNERLGTIVELICIDVEKLHRESVPKNVDHVIVWSKFVSHHHREIVFSAVEPRKISEHFAGLTELGEFIEQLCGLAPALAR